MSGDGEAAQAEDVAMGEGSSILLALVFALKAANDPMAAKEKKAAASHLLPLLFLSLPATFCTATGRLEKDAEPMVMLWVGDHKAPPGREEEEDHCDARYLDLAVACRPTEKVAKAQAAILDYY